MAAPARSRILRQLAEKDAPIARIAMRVEKEPSLLSELIDGLGAQEARVKYGSSKVLRKVSEDTPELLYPRFHFFAAQLDCGNAFLQWDAVRILGNMTRVDRENHLERMLDRYLEPIDGPHMIGAATIMQSGATIALARPDLAVRIAKAILRVENAVYQTMECRRVAAGHAIESLDRFYHLIPELHAEVTEFVRRQLLCSRAPTARKAERWLKKREPGRKVPARLGKKITGSAVR